MAERTGVLAGIPVWVPLAVGGLVGGYLLLRPREETGRVTVVQLPGADAVPLPDRQAGQVDTPLPPPAAHPLPPIPRPATADDRWDAVDPLRLQQAFLSAREQLGAQYPYWLTAPLSEIAAELRRQPTLMVGQEAREVLVGLPNLPPPAAISAPLAQLDAALETAREQLGAQYPYWLTAPLSEIAAELRQQPTLMAGQEAREVLLGGHVVLPPIIPPVSTVVLSVDQALSSAREQLGAHYGWWRTASLGDIVAELRRSPQLMAGQEAREVLLRH